METADDAYTFGRDIAGFASERAARLRATHADPSALAIEIARQVEGPATRALATKLAVLKREGMPVPVAVAWAEAAMRGYRERMAEHEPLH